MMWAAGLAMSEGMGMRCFPAPCASHSFVCRSELSVAPMEPLLRVADLLQHGLKKERRPFSPTSHRTNALRIFGKDEWDGCSCCERVTSARAGKDNLPGVELEASSQYVFLSPPRDSPWFP